MAQALATPIGGLSIKCARVGGVEIPNNKRVEYSLQYIHGIGRTSAKQILNDLNFENKLTKDFSEEELTTLREEVSKYMIEGDLMGFEANSSSRKWPGLGRQHHSKSGSFPNSKRNEEGKLVQSAGASSGRKLVLLQDWWLVKADPDSHGKQLGIGGFTLRKNQGIRSFSSAPIVKRLDAVTLQTVDSITIMVHGYLNRSRTLVNGFSQEVCDNFLIGFPYYWEDFTALSVSEEPQRVSPSDADKTPAEEAHGPNMMCRSIFDDMPADASSVKETSMSMQSMDSVSEEPKGVSPSAAYKTPAQEARGLVTSRNIFDDTPAETSSVKKDSSIDQRITRAKKKRTSSNLAGGPLTRSRARLLEK